MARTSRRSGKTNAVKFNFKNVSNRISHAGKYVFECVACKQKEGDKAPFFETQWKAVEAITGNDRSVGGTVYDNLSTSENSLWKIKNVLDAGGYDFPDDEDFEMSEDEFIGLRIMAEVSIEEYRTDSGTGKSYKIDSDSIEPAPKGKGTKKKAATEEAEEDDEKPTKRRRKDADEEEATDEPKGRSGRRRRASKDEDDADEDVGPKAGKTRRASDDEDEKPKRKKSTYTEDAVLDMDEEKLEKLIDKVDLDIDLDDYKSIRQMRRAVIDALEAEELLEDD